MDRAEKSGIFASVDEATQAFNESPTLQLQWQQSEKEPGQEDEQDSNILQQQVSSDFRDNMEIYQDCLCVNVAELRYLSKKTVKALQVAPFNGWTLTGNREVCYAVICDSPDTDLAGINR